MQQRIRAILGSRASSMAILSISRLIHFISVILCIKSPAKLDLEFIANISGIPFTEVKKLKEMLQA